MLYRGRLNLLKNVIYTFLLFLFIYQFRLEVIGLPPQIHSTRIGALGVVLLGVFTKVNKHNDLYYKKVGFFKYCYLCLFLLFYSFVLIVFTGKGTGIHMIDAVLNNLIITIPVIWGLTRIFEDIDSFFSILIYVGLLQSIFIILCLTNESFQLMIDHMFNTVDSETHNILNLRKGYAGGIGCITAGGMIRYSISLLATSYLYVKTGRFRYFITFIVFAVLNSMISRTGLLVDVCCFIYITSQMNRTKSFFRYSALLLLVIVFFILILNSGKYDSFIEERYHRLTSLKETGLKEDFFNGYFGGQIPSLQDNIILGTGILSGISPNGIVVHVDGGPLRIYSAVGLILSILIYLFLFKVLLTNIRIQYKKIDKRFMFLVLVFFIIADFKEITFFIAWPLSIYFTISVLLYKSSHCLDRVDNVH